MANYLKIFEDKTAYNLFVSHNEEYPVSHIVRDIEIDFLDITKKYLTFVARESGSFTLTIGSAVTTSILESISYSLDNGENWTTTNNVNNQTVTITTPTVEQGQRVIWKGSGVGVSTTTNNSNRPSTSSIFSSTGEFDIEGNIMSLIYDDDFADKDYVPNGSSYNFALLFYANTGHVGTNYAKVVSAEKLILPIKNVPTCCYFRMFQESYTLGTVQPNNTLIKTPLVIDAENVGVSACTSMFLGCTSISTVQPYMLPATTLADSCYLSIFQNCTSLTNAPELPATTLGYHCYIQMFTNCTSLTVAPELQATTLAQGCYEYMFANCTNLTVAPELPATTLEESCYAFMFSGCTSLTTIPSDYLSSATALTRACYNGIFCDCSSLTNLPELTATTLTEECYDFMFKNCTSLATIPSDYLPATGLTYRCYCAMFAGCTGLTEAPLLPAPTLARQSYDRMFSGCTNLNYIKCLATDISATDCTKNWVANVAPSGTFVKDSSMSDWTIDSPNGVPIGWTLKDDVEPLIVTYYAYGGGSGGPDRGLVQVQLYFYYEAQYEDEPSALGVNMFEKIIIDGIEVSIADIDANYGGYLLSEGSHTVEYILKDPTMVGANMNTRDISGVFDSCTAITSVQIPNGVTNVGYLSFSHCDGLTSVTLPNTVEIIARWSFAYSNSLQTINIPSSVQTIESQAFACDSNLDEPSYNAIYNINPRAFECAE